MKFEVFKDRLREWRWRTRAKNGRVTSTGAEGYRRKNACLKAVKKHIEQTANAEVEVAGRHT